jgi:hypothetical protein
MLDWMPLAMICHVCYAFFFYGFPFILSTPSYVTRNNNYSNVFQYSRITQGHIVLEIILGSFLILFYILEFPIIKISSWFSDCFSNCFSKFKAYVKKEEWEAEDPGSEFTGQIDSFDLF